MITLTSTDPSYAITANLVTKKNEVGHRDFRHAKQILPLIYEGLQEDFYCGCAYKDKTMDLESCGYQVRKQAQRAAKLEWEHVIPAWALGHQQQCWQEGGRKACGNNPEFNLAEGDLYNLVPSVGEVNGDRSNFGFNEWTANPIPIYGFCQTIIDFKQRQVQPRPEVRGRIARIAFYMNETHHLQLSRQDRQLYCSWAKIYPIDSWEKLRNNRIYKYQGNRNRFVDDVNATHLFCEKI